MSTIFRSLVLAVSLFTVGLPSAHAQGLLGGNKLGIGGGKTAESESVELPSPEQLEADLVKNVQLNLTIVASIFDALGEKGQAEIAEKNAACLEKGECGVADALGAAQKSSKDLKDVLASREKAETKVSPEEAQKLQSAFGRSIEWIVSGVTLVKTIKAITKDRMGAVKTYGAKTVSVLAKVPPFVVANGSTISSGLTYLTYSGLDTSDMQKQLAAATADL